MGAARPFEPGEDPRRHALTSEEQARGRETMAARRRELAEAKAALAGLPLPVRQEVEAAARVHALRAVEVLQGIMEDEAQPVFARIAAARELLDRGGFVVPRHLRVQAAPDIAAAAEALSRDRLSPETEAKLAAAWRGVAADLAAGGRGSGGLVALPEGDAGQERA